MKHLFSILTIERKYETYRKHFQLVSFQVTQSSLCIEVSRAKPGVKTCSCGNVGPLFSRHKNGGFNLGLEVR